MRVLLSEGSSLSARETITALGLGGQSVEIITSDTHCLGRFSKFVTAVHKAPSAGSDPSGYLAAVLDVLKKRQIDVLMPVHEQAYLFAARRELIPANVGLALASFQAFEEVQSKERLTALLSRLRVPQPQTRIRKLADLDKLEHAYPFFVKTAFGTASVGVWRVQNASDKRSVAAALARDGITEVVVQSEVDGKLERAQSVFDHGRLVAFHTYRQLAPGPGGGDVLKLSVVRPEALAHVEKIGAALAWHGALSFDYLVDDATGVPLFIDANPRLVEPISALLSGVDLAQALLDVSLGKSPPRQAQGKAGVATRLGMMGLLEAAGRRGSRIDVLREALLLISNKGRYRGTVEELTPVRSDYRSLIPLIAVAVRLLRSPTASARMRGETVRHYSLTSETIARLQRWNAEHIASLAAALAATQPIPL
jgi:hypothetical protein